MFTSTSSNRTTPTYRSQPMTTLLWKQLSTSAGSSLKPSATIFIRLRSSTASCLKAPDRRPALARLLRDPEGAIAELKSQFTNDSMKTLLRAHIERDIRRLDQHVQAFARQLTDFMQIEVLNRQGQLRFFRRLLNFDDWRVAGKPQSMQFLDYQVVNSDIEAERDHLRVGDHIVRVLTMKEAINETRPLVLDALLKIAANYYVVTEWTPLPADKARKEVNKRRRHFNMSKTGFVSQMGNDATKTNPRDVLVDESKQADIENLGDCLRGLGDGQSLGDFS